MSSRFFATTYSDSESEEELLSSSAEEEELSSSEEEELSSSEEESDEDDELEEDEDEEDEVPRNKFLKSEAPQRSAAYFLKGSNIPDSDDETESESDDDNKKVVKSAKDKLLEELKNSADEIDSASDFDDWITVSKEFDKLNKLLVKAQQQNIATPAFYIKTLAELEDIIVAVSKENPKMNGVTSKAFNSIKQRVRRTSKDYESQIAKYREDPEGFEKESTVEPTPQPVSSLYGKKAGIPARSATEGEEVDIPTTLRTVIENRGKKNVDRFEQVKTLESLLDLASTPFQYISIYLLLIPTRFDISLNANYMSPEQWKKSQLDISSLIEVLEDNSAKYRVTENAEPGFDFETEPEANSEGVVEILGSIASFVERLDDELTRALLVADPHSSDYIARLKDESTIYNLILRAQLYIESFTNQKELISDSNEQLFRIILRRIDHIYFKPIQLINFNEKLAWDNIPKNKDSYITKRPGQLNKTHSDGLVNALSSILYRQSKSVYRKKAMLTHIYYYAFNDQYFKARDMLLMSHLQSSIHTSDPALQVLFNRVLVQLGLAAFKAGLIEESFQTLQEIATSNRRKELLGQGVQRYNSSQQSTTSLAADRQRLLPFHTHINLQLLEAVFLTSSLLIEVPQSAQTDNSNLNRKSAVKSFKRALEFHDKQYFQGPPENARDYIMHAAKSLQLGDWKKASNYINSVESWSLFSNAEQIKKMIKDKLQIEGLRTYIFQFRNYYTKLSIKKLAEIFELKESKVTSVLSKMIFKEEIFAALDQKTSSVYFIHGHELNKTQELAVTLAEKVGQLAEKNERLAAGGHQQQPQAHSQSHGNNNNHSRNHHSSQNFKINFGNNSGGIIAGALNGMDNNNKRGGRRQQRK